MGTNSGGAIIEKLNVPYTLNCDLDDFIYSY
jgi:hypothetical protein